MDAWLRSKFSAEHVKNEMQPRCQSVNRNFSPRIFVRIALVLLLLVAVASLSTLAKDGQYFPRTNPVRHVSLSTAMNVAHPPVVIAGDRLQSVARVAPPPPAVRVTRLEQFETAPVQRISVTVSMQHRSPPSSLA
jgi:hypothetical protein